MSRPPSPPLKTAPRASMGSQEGDQPELTFAQAAEAVLEEARRSWTTPGTLAQWRRSIDVHATPFRDKALAQITTDDIARGLAPLWTAKPALAGKVRKHWERVLDHSSAFAGGLRDYQNPATWAPPLRARLQGPSPRSKTWEGHEDLPAMMQRLRGGRGLARLALEVAMLTVCEPHAVRRLAWAQVKRGSEGWTAAVASTQRRSGRRDDVGWRLVPLDDAIARRLADAAPQAAGVGGDESPGWVFAGVDPRRPIAAGAVDTLSAKLFGPLAPRLQAPALQSSFQSWADGARKAHSEAGGGFDRELVEAALSTVTSEKDPLADPRPLTPQVRELFSAWRGFLEGAEPDTCPADEAQGR